MSLKSVAAAAAPVMLDRHKQSHVEAVHALNAATRAYAKALDARAVARMRQNDAFDPSAVSIVEFETAVLEARKVLIEAAQNGSL